MTCRVDTTDLIDLLTDLIVTAEQRPDAGAIASILLHTTRAQLGTEPGRTDILAGLSTDRAAADPASYPGPRIYRTLMSRTADIIDTPKPGCRAEALPRTDLRQTALAAFAKVAKRRGMPVEMYRTHQNEPVHVQVGHSYRGLLMPLEYHADGDERGPAAEVHAPDLARLEKLMADAVAAKNGTASKPQTEPLFSTTGGS